MVSIFMQQLGPSWMDRRQGHGKIGDPMCAWKQSRKNSGVGSVGDWARSEGLRETDSIPRQPVQGGSFDVLVTVAVNVVGTQSIDGDQENIGRRRFRLRWDIGMQDRSQPTDKQETGSPHGVSD